MPSNPLLTQSPFAHYSQIRAEHIVPAVNEIVATAKARLEEILSHGTASATNSATTNTTNSQTTKISKELTFSNVHLAFIEMEDMVERVWTPVENMLSLVGTDDIRKTAEEARELVVAFYNEYSLDERVYKLIKDYDKSPDAKSLQGEYLRYHQDTLKDLRLSGAELEGADKEEFKKLNLELAQLCQNFSDNVTDSKFELHLTKSDEIAGLPPDFIEAAKHAASTKGLSGWLINLDYPSFGPFMKFSDRGDLRRKLYIEFLSKASPSKHPERDNTKLIAKIVRAKTRKANLVGFNNYAEYSLCTKMAERPEKVLQFLERLAKATKSLAQKEYQDLVDFQNEIGYKNTENNPQTVYPWDKDYLSEKLRKVRYDLDSNQIKEYFELNSCLQGMFSIAERLFGIRIQPSADAIETWHEDVQVYEILDATSNNLIGYFYTDLFPRDTKRQGAWMMPLVQGEKTTNGYRKPQCVLACNLTKPLGDRPSLLTHLEVTTLFHEFGHGLHHLLTTAELAPMAGTNVEWDFVELPSQLLENFCWEIDSLSLFAKHHKTKEPIPKALLEKIIKARKFNEGLACVRQLEFALFDLAVYMRDINQADDDVNSIFKKIVKEHGVFPVVEETNFPASFSHIFAGGYAAGYYSYKWAELLEADAFSRFKNEGILNSELGKAYRETILEKGDTEPPMELFKKFMGREPNENALLERMGVPVNA